MNFNTAVKSRFLLNVYTHKQSHTKFLFQHDKPPKNNLVHTNPELSFSIRGKVRIVRGKQMNGFSF